MLSPQHIPTLDTQHSSVCESGVAWLPQVAIDLSFWHGGRKLKDLERFEWPGDVVEGPALALAQKNCALFGIEQSSSLEMWAFRSDWIIANTRSDIDLHWFSVGPNPRAAHKILVSHRPVWSSKRGALPPLHEWRMFQAGFIKFVTVKGSLSPTDDWSEHITALLAEPTLMAGLQDLALVDGRITDLKVVHRGVFDSGSQLILVTGSVRVAVGQYADRSNALDVEQAVNSALEVQLLPTSELLEFDVNDTVLRPTVWKIVKIQESV
ncbi:hypothetical protein FQ186_25885 [Pseudomonas sp. ANT_H14]|uniref:hypothetical protein n=1 Tax=unclassified Pseudomonas TaxID=196821 RepID=UPI0011EEAC9C|nr:MULTISPECIES: hypothetical protein [unclassified Pseudomonas]KAA0946224.1 hypothetical protein FQ182_13660 [Pseudomonas sp. ANT_H4]KAA0947138.1 hypothetical protein FQ186_25885 [Pseudomonas sp. ANT_H14]